MEISDGQLSMNGFVSRAVRSSWRCLALLPALLAAGCGSRSDLFDLGGAPASGGSAGAGGSAGTAGSGATAGSSGAGGCPTGMVTPIVLDEVSGSGVAVGGDTVYFSLLDGRVGKTGLLGGPVTQLPFVGESPSALALDGPRLFTASVDAQLIVVTATDGSSLQPLAENQPAPQSLALDAGHVFWINYGYGIKAGSVARVAKDGGEVEVLAGSIDQGIDVAVDDDAVYFTSWGIDAGVYRIDKATLELQWLLGTPDRPTGIAIDEESIYFAVGDLSGTTSLGKMPKLGGEVEFLNQDLPRVLRLAVDESHVYFTASGKVDLTGTTGRVPKTGGAMETLAVTSDALHSSLALDKEAVYFTRAWLEDVGPPADGGAVVRVCK